EGSSMNKQLAPKDRVQVSQTFGPLLIFYFCKLFPVSCLDETSRYHALGNYNNLGPGSGAHGGKEKRS
ncbi:MAG: hypothetical protein ACP5U1_10145, partial [Desulfomonilaceae bacterium]